MVATTEVFMRLRLDTSHAGADGKVAGEAAGKEFGDGFTRDSNGKLRDARGKFVSDLGQAGSDAGKSFGDGFTRDSSGRLRDARGKFVKDFGQAGSDAGKAFGGGFGDEASKTIRDVGNASKAAKGDLADFGGTVGKLGNIAMPALIGAGVALSPVLITLATGAAGLAVAAVSTVGPILKAASAAGGLEQNLSKLNPVQQQMARQLLGLKGEADGFAKSLQPQVVRLWGDGMGIAANVLKAIQPVASATGDALHTVLLNLNANFHTQQWTDFFAFMAQHAGPDTKLLGQNLIDLVNILPQLLTNLQPVAVEILQATDATFKLVDAVDKLDTASIHLGDSSQHSATWMSIVGNAVKNAAQQMLPAGGAVLPALSKGLNAVSSNGRPAALAITAVSKAAVAAAPVVGTLSGDVAILGTTTSNSTVALKAFSDLWDIFVGKAVTDQQAVLNVRQAFEQFNAAVKQGGRGSTAAQLAYLGLFTSIGAGLDTLHKNGASVQQINAFYTTSIARLNALHGLTPLQRQDIAGLTKDYLAWANSVTGLSGNVVKAAGHIRNDFLTAMSLAHRLVPTARADADQFAASVLKTGTNSRATAGDRQRLINDLVHSGLSAADARAQVKAFQDRINALKGKSVNVDLTTSGHGTIVITGTGINQRTINTTTGTLRGPGGHTIRDGAFIARGAGPRVDDFPALLARGELVVPAHMVSAGLVDHLRGAIPGFANGGVVGKTALAESGIASADATWAAVAATAFAQAAVKAQQKALAGFLGPGSGNYAADIAAVLTAMGLPLSLVPNWERQIATESGGNLRAVNLTDSNAQAGHPSVGLLQLIPATFAAYAGPYRNTPPLVNFGGGFVSENAMAQIYAGIHYAAARYGSSMGAVIGHGHGYDRGGPILEPVLGVGLRSGEPYGFAMNGVPETVVPGGGGRSVHVHFNGMVVIREEADLNLLAQKLAFTLASSGAP